MEEGQPCGCLVLDLAFVATLFTDSVAKLVQLQKILKSRSGSLVLRHLSSAAKETLDHLKLSKSFVIEEEAAPAATSGETSDTPPAPEGNEFFVNEYAPSNLASVPK